MIIIDLICRTPETINIANIWLLWSGLGHLGRQSSHLSETKRSSEDTWPWLTCGTVRYQGTHRISHSLSHMEVSWNMVTLQSSIFIGFPWISHFEPSIWGYPHLWQPPYPHGPVLKVLTTLHSTTSATPMLAQMLKTTWARDEKCSLHWRNP